VLFFFSASAVASWPPHPRCAGRAPAAWSWSWTSLCT
jgi:hypothetical protein